MAATAHPCGSISFNSAGNAPRVPTSSASSLSRGRFPTARKQRVVGGGRRLALGALEFDASYGFGSSRWSCRLLEAGERGLAIRPRVSAGGAGEGGGKRRRPRFLCLHGFRTSGEIMRRQVAGKWPAEVTSRLDLAFADAPFPAQGESPVCGVFDPPYYEWCRFVGENFLEYRNFGECLAKIEELMVREGPFDGLLGFSQGGLLSAALAGLQEQGLALNRVAKLKYVIVISGGKIQSPAMAAEAYANKIKCPSLHFIAENSIHLASACLCAGDNDLVKTHAEELVESFVDPLVVRHPGGHTVPRLDEKGLRVMLAYLDKIEMGLSPPSSTDAEDKSAGVVTLNLES